MLSFFCAAFGRVRTAGRNAPNSTAIKNSTASRINDAKGTANLYEKRRIHIEIEGEGILAAFGNADPQSIESYDASCWETYDGYALAAVRAGDKKGAVSVTVWMEGKEEQKQKITIPVN